MHPSLLTKNINALRPFLRPQVIDLLHEFQPSTTVTNALDLSSINITKNGTNLYNTSALDASVQQVRQFLSKPSQIKFDDRLIVNPANISGWGDAVRADLYSHIVSSTALEKANYDTAGFLVSFGLGLGIHIPLLISKLQVREILVFEPEFEYFYQSLQYIDWQPIVEKIQSQNGRIQFFFETNDVIAYFILENSIKGKNYGMVEGSYLFQHYPHKNFQNIYQRFTESLGTLLSYNGWMEDEILHVSNHVQNLSTQSFSLLNPQIKPVKQKNSHAIVVGSGPSLEKGIEILKTHREKLTIFSAGTALKSLLENNITPDYHCELENVEIVSTITSYLSQQFDLSNVTLIASSTITPNAAHNFREILFFKRETSGSLRFLNQNIPEMNSVAPSATNTAAKMADFLGFTSVYLLGVDYGAKDIKQRYVKGVIYESAHQLNQTQTSKNSPRLAEAGSTSQAMNIKVKGNLGSDILTNRTLTFMRNRFEETIFELDAKISNISDGAAIKGATPLPLQDFTNNMELFSGKKPHIDIEAIYPTSTKQIRLTELNELEQKIKQLWDQFKTRLENFSCQTDMSIDMLYDFFSEFLYFELEETESTLTHAVRSNISGDLLKIFHMIRYFECRMLIGKEKLFSLTFDTLNAYLPLMESNSLSKISEARELAGLPASITDHRSDIIWQITSGKDLNEKADDILEDLRQAPLPAKLKEYLICKLINHHSLTYTLEQQDNSSVLEIITDLDISHITLSRLLQAFYFDPALHENSLPAKLTELRNASKSTNPSSALLRVSAQIDFLIGNFEAAFEQLDLAIQKEPKSPIPLLWKSNFLILSGNAEEGIKLVEDIPKPFSSKPSLAIYALGLYRIGCINEALEILSQPNSFWYSEPSPDITVYGQYFYAYLLAEEGRAQESNQQLSILKKIHPQWEARASYLYNYRNSVNHQVEK